MAYTKFYSLLALHWSISDSYSYYNICIFLAIAIKESAMIGDKSQRRSAKGVEDLGKNQVCDTCLHFQDFESLT